MPTLISNAENIICRFETIRERPTNATCEITIFNFEIRFCKLYSASSITQHWQSGTAVYSVLSFVVVFFATHKH